MMFTTSITALNKGQLYILTGDNNSISSDTGYSSKEIYTRLTERTIYLSENPAIYNHPVTNNYDKIKNPHHRKEFNEEMIVLTLSAGTIFDYRYPYRILINREQIDQSHRFLDRDNNILLEYIYIPKSLCDENSEIIIDILIIPNMETIKKIQTYKSAPQIRIKCNNKEFLHKDIMVASTDQYEAITIQNIETPPSNNSYACNLSPYMSDMSTLAPSKFRVWLVNEDGFGTLLDKSNYTLSGSTLLINDFDNTKKYLIECLPYREEELSVHPYDEVLNNDRGKIRNFSKSNNDMPIDPDLYDIYADGILLDKYDVKCVSFNHLYFNDQDLAKSEIRIITKMHDSLRAYTSEEMFNSSELKDFNDKMIDKDPEYAAYIQYLVDKTYNDSMK